MGGRSCWSSGRGCWQLAGCSRSQLQPNGRTGGLSRASVLTESHRFTLYRRHGGYILPLCTIEGNIIDKIHFILDCKKTYNKLIKHNKLVKDEISRGLFLHKSNFTSKFLRRFHLNKYSEVKLAFEAKAKIIEKSQNMNIFFLQQNFVSPQFLPPTSQIDLVTLFSEPADNEHFKCFITLRALVTLSGDG